MKICIINNLYQPFSRGGAEIITSIIVEGLGEAGHDIFVISTKPYWYKNPKDDKKIYRIRSLFDSLDRIPIIFRFFWHIFDMFDIFTAIKVFAIIKKESPQAVITNNLKGLSLLIPLVIKISGIKNMHILHDIQLLHPSGLMIYGKEKIIESIFARIYQFFNKVFFKYTNVIISPSEWLLSLHLKKGFFSKSINKVINNPAITEWPESLLKKSFSYGSKSFLFVGMIEEHKGIELLLESFIGSLTRLPENFDLKIIGDGSILEKCQKKYINKKINFLGRLTHDATIVYMVNSYCLVVPSLCYENSPTVVYEALSVNLPVLASNIGGLGELIKKTAGELFMPADRDDLTNKILKISNYPEKMAEIGQDGIEKINKFKAKYYIDNISKLIAV
jgi:glycosyltransferase involved in cell wall biosynthesis